MFEWNTATITSPVKSLVNVTNLVKACSELTIKIYSLKLSG